MSDTDECGRARCTNDATHVCEWPDGVVSYCRGHALECFMMFDPVTRIERMNQ